MANDTVREQYMKAYNDGQERMQSFKDKLPVYCGPCKYRVSRYGDDPCECAAWVKKEYDSYLKRCVILGRCSIKNKNNDCTDYREAT